MHEDFEIEIHCPDCDAAMEVKLSQIATKELVTCPGCTRKIQLQPDPKPGPEELHTIDESLKNINQKLRARKENP
jgi:hypothetical protein